MLRLFSFFSRFRIPLVFFLLAGAAVLFMIYPGAGLSRAAKSASFLLAGMPLRLMGWTGSEGISEERYHRMQRTALELALENSYLKEMEKENIRLRRLLSFREKSRYRFLAAEVIGRDPDLMNNSIIIRGGRNMGLKPDMPVLVAEGLVGKITDVSLSSSVVQLLLDQNARVSAICQRSREVGILEWSGGNRCRLNNIEKRDDIKPGDVILTSGMGGVYPKGIVIGTVAAVDAGIPGLFKEVQVQLNVDFSYLEEIFILTGE